MVIKCATGVFYCTEKLFILVILLDGWRPAALHKVKWIFNGDSI